jgi:DnaJ-class molecular chaperone
MRTQVGGKIYKTCPKCKGNGSKPFMVGNIPVGGTKVKCDLCEGRGKLEEKPKGEEVIK